MKVRAIDLKGHIPLPNDAAIEFLRAELPLARLHSPFALIRYALRGVEQEYGLRLDLDKRVFLDHFDDEELEQVAQNAVLRIVEVVGDALYPRAALPQDAYFSPQAEIAS